jgi:hypothetical protein
MGKKLNFDKDTIFVALFTKRYVQLGTKHKIAKICKSDFKSKMSICGVLSDS